MNASIDYKNSILNIPNSILKHYGAEPLHSTSVQLDRVLSSGYRNVVLLVLDGLGNDMLEKNFPDSFLIKNRNSVISSVFPSTTTAALTTFETAKSPIEHGWLGWSCWFKELNKSVDIFTNNQTGTSEPAADYHVARKYMSYTHMFERIQAVNPEVKCCGVSPFHEYKAINIPEICDAITEICSQAGQHYIYAYNNKPDDIAHEHGCYSKQVKDFIINTDNELERLCGQLSDTLLIVTADHGLVDSTRVSIYNYPDIAECLANPPSLEGRAASLFIKPEFKSEFPERWNKQFGSDFILLSKEEALEQVIFGPGNPHAKSLDFIGDYVAIATGKTCVWYPRQNGKLVQYIGNHAGLTNEELYVPLVIVECR